LNFPQHLHIAKTIVFGLPFGESHIIVGLFMMKLYQYMTGI